MLSPNICKHGQRIILTSLSLILLTACGSPAATPLTAPATAIPTLAPAATAEQAVSAVPTGAIPAATTSQADTACTTPAALTPAITEGPYYKAGSPERASLLETGTTGMILTLTGYVLTSNCQPVAHALLDFWQANSAGQYDNSGYTLRGHQYTDANGFYQLVTVVPGLYPGRTEHIHVKVQASGGPILTSQLFFPGVPGNQTDGIYDPTGLIQVHVTTASSMQASFTFIIAAK